MEPEVRTVCSRTGQAALLPCCPVCPAPACVQAGAARHAAAARACARTRVHGGLLQQDSQVERAGQQLERQHQLQDGAAQVAVVHDDLETITVGVGQGHQAGHVAAGGTPWTLGACSPELSHWVPQALRAPLHAAQPAPTLAPNSARIWTKLVSAWMVPQAAYRRVGWQGWPG